MCFRSFLKGFFFFFSVCASGLFPKVLCVFVCVEGPEFGEPSGRRGHGLKEGLGDSAGSVLSSLKVYTD